MTGHTSGAHAGGPTKSLRREWSSAIIAMLVLLLVAGGVTILGVRGLVDRVTATALQLRQESVAVSVLRSEMVDHEEVGHKLLSDEAVDRAAFVRQQQAISVRFAAVAKIFPTTDDLRATVLRTERSWQAGLSEYGLWGSQVKVLHGDHLTENPTFGASSDATDGMLDGLSAPSLDAMSAGLARGGDLENLLSVTLAGLIAFAVALTLYFRRRLRSDLLSPLASMRHGVLKLRSGELDYRIEVARHDELGELAEAFNEMAGTLHDSHVALTVRATHDPLTGLPNRAALTERLAASFAPGPDHRAQHESVLFIDVDDFKDVNDSMGHESGDALLSQIADRLNGCVRPYDMVARLGGDEFAIVAVEQDNSPTAIGIAERILEAMSTPFALNGASLAVSVSIGVAQRRPTTTDAAELLRHADFAMYMAKGGGKGRYQIFDAQVHDSMIGRAALKEDLATALSSGQLLVEYEPIVDLGTGAMLGLEASLRWQHPTLGRLGPAEFIPIAEETGDIQAIGYWALETATRQMAIWNRDTNNHGGVWVSVNLSAFQLADPSSLSAVQRVLTDPEAHADHVVIQVTEAALAADIDGGTASLNTLKGLGARIAIDGFGTGFSSLSALARLPVDIVKIDASSVSDQTPGAAERRLLEGVFELASKLSLAVIAKGVQTPGQVDLLRTMGCGMAQGNLLGGPISAQGIEELLATGGIVPVDAFAGA